MVENLIKLRVNPGLDPGRQFWADLLADSINAPEASGVFVFQLVDDGEIVVRYDVAVRFWRWASQRSHFYGRGRHFDRGPVPAILFEPLLG